MLILKQGTCITQGGPHEGPIVLIENQAMCARHGRIFLQKQHMEARSYETATCYRNMLDAFEYLVDANV